MNEPDDQINWKRPFNIITQLGILVAAIASVVGAYFSYHEDAKREIELNLLRKDVARKNLEEYKINGRAYALGYYFTESWLIHHGQNFGDKLRSKEVSGLGAPLELSLSAICKDMGLSCEVKELLEISDPLDPISSDKIGPTSLLAAEIANKLDFETAIYFTFGSAMCHVESIAQARKNNFKPGYSTDEIFLSECEFLDFVLKGRKIDNLILIYATKPDYPSVIDSISDVNKKIRAEYLNQLNFHLFQNEKQ